MEILPEVEVWYGLPAIRRQLALTLKKQGLSQKGIAEKLGIGESAVSQYLTGKRGGSEIPGMEALFFASATRISKGDRDVMVREVMQLVQHMRESRAICEVHKQHSRDIPDGCDHCF